MIGPALSESLSLLPSNKHRVEHHPQPPHVGRPARVLGVGPQDLGGDVGGTAVFVRQKVVSVVLKNNGVLQRLQLDLSPETKDEVSWCSCQDDQDLTSNTDSITEMLMLI